jgi:hypothetical protein
MQLFSRVNLLVEKSFLVMQGTRRASYIFKDLDAIREEVEPVRGIDKG